VKPTRLAWDHRWKLYMDGRLFDLKNDVLEKSPIADSDTRPETKSARTKLQPVLDQMVRVKPPKFNKYEPDGHPAY